MLVATLICWLFLLLYCCYLLLYRCCNVVTCCCTVLFIAVLLLLVADACWLLYCCMLYTCCCTVAVLLMFVVVVVVVVLMPLTSACRYSNDEQSFPNTNDERSVSFVVNDGAFNSTPAMTCIRLVDSNDLPELFTGPNGTVDTMVMYREGQTEPLLVASQLEIRGKGRMCESSPSVSLRHSETSDPTNTHSWLANSSLEGHSS